MTAGGIPRVLAVLFVVGALFAAPLSFLVTIRSQPGHYLVWSDGLAYFSFARSLVIDGDLDVTNEFDALEARAPRNSELTASLRSWSRRDPASGRLVVPWPAGAGVVLAPFYAVGYGVERVVASAQHRPPDSYGVIPQVFFCLGSVAASLAGLFATAAFARRDVADTAAWLAAIGVATAGPLLFYTFVHPSMAHAISAGIAAVLLLVWRRQWDAGTSVREIVLPAFLLGVMVTIRYQNALFGILLAALVLAELRRAKPGAVARIAAAGIVAAALPLLVLVPQIVATHAAQGLAQHDATIQAGGYPINLRSPYFLDVLLSSRHGAFFWAPLLGIAFVGLLVAAVRRGWARVLVAVFAANVYLIGGLALAGSNWPADGSVESWVVHWHGSPSFGMRYLAECGPVLAPGLALAIAACLRVLPTLVVSGGVALFALWNAALVLAYGLGTISRSGSLTYSEMGSGVLRALRLLADRLV